MSTCKIELSHRGEACDACPDYVTFPIDGELLQAIASARAMLSLDLLGVCPEIVLSLPDAGEFFVDCGDGDEPYEAGDGAGDFEASSGWLTISQRGDMRVTFWDDNTDDELVGDLDDADLRLAIDSAVPAAVERIKSTP